VPMWYHEGWAQTESLAGMTRLFERATRRHYLWDQRAMLLSYSDLESWSWQSDSELPLLHISAFEWFRYLEASYGKAEVLNVFRGVSIGLTFEEAFLDAFGTTCAESYADWLRYFTGVETP